MAGVRIRATDPALANKTLELEHVRRTAAGPKVYRLRLDDTAATIVSPVVWDRLQEAMAALPGCPQFYPVETIHRPPDQTIGGRVEAVDLVRYSLARGVTRMGDIPVPKVTLR